MTLSLRIVALLRNTFDTLFYFAAMAVKENFRNYVGRAGVVGRPSQELVLLANGPSLGEELPRLLAGERAGCDFLAVNYFAEHEAFERLRGLGEEADVAVEVEAFDVLGAFDDDGASCGLTDEADDLSVSRLAIDDKLRVRFLVGHALDAALELQDDGAGGVDDVDAVCACRSVGLRWLTMGAEQHFGVVQAAECCVAYRF